MLNLKERPMKMIMVVCPENREEEVRELIVKHDVHAYSELHDVTGEGEKGRRLGTRIWPGKLIIILLIVSDEKKRKLAAALKEYRNTLLSDESIRAFVVPVEEEL